ncbi:MAG: beta-glucuronidase [Ruminococcaceae bacterium]|nr:beta-glucuronidase [Oscillospiraceae bacterium]
MLYPQMNEKRLLISLNGIWNFMLGNEELSEASLTEPLANPERLYVPASYNEQKADKRFYEHFGWAYYQRYFSIPKFENKRIVLRFSAVAHNCIVYLNKKEIARHRGGFLPFEVEISDSVLSENNFLCVAVDNRINYSTLPVGNEFQAAMFASSLPDFESVRKTKPKNKNYPNFDFFNYCGINRDVCLCITEKGYIDDITVNSDISGKVRFDVKTSNDEKARVEILSDNKVVASGFSGEELFVENPVLWQIGKAYLYTAKVSTANDCYYQKFAFREIKIDGTKFLINGKPFYFKGFGKHEDSEVHGRGIDEVLNVKDISLMKWMGANSFRTSHYPYSEEMLNLCDEEGIAVIAETPAVGLNNNSYDKTFEYHKQVLQDMINRDKNHPCVVMWSLANEPDSISEKAYDYFMPLYNLAHECDPQSRPVTTVVCNNDYVKDRVCTEMDVICVNRYYGWYIFPGDLDAAVQATNEEMKYFENIGKPLMITEYGADAVSGIHSVYETMFSEEFQKEYYKAVNSVIDKYSFVIGEHAWNFADFQTVQGTMRADGNKKGVFTRERRPKMAAHYLKNRWQSIPDFDYKK